jgi:hypothetical protein
MGVARVANRRRGMPTSDAALATGALAIGAAVLLDPAAVEHGPVVCPVRLLTGLPCPGCGSVRAWTAAVHGDLAAAVAHNPFAVVLLVATVLLLVARLGALVRRAPAPDIVALLTRPLALAFAATWCAWALARALDAAT